MGLQYGLPSGVSTLDLWRERVYTLIRHFPSRRVLF